MYRALILLSLAVFVVTPVADQLACGFCGPSAETTATAKPVPHTEDDCILQDGFERPSQSPDTESTHIHFCLLHATSIALDFAYGFDFTPEVSEFELKSVDIEDPYAPSLFHPPTAS
jgi:hypothetical protein